MNCPSCSTALLSDVKFCTNCGLAMGKPVAAVDYSSKYRYSKLFKILGYLFFPLLAMDIVSLFVGESGRELISRIVNLILGFVLAISVLGLMIGFIVAIVLLVDSQGKKGLEEKSYYQRMATWAVCGPLFALVGVIVLYVIGTVIKQFIT